MPSPPLIRPATPADLDALEALENRVFASDRLSRRSLRYYIARPRGPLLVAGDDGDVHGYALLGLGRGRAARLYSLATLPEMAGSGIGRALLTAAEQLARAQGFAAIRLEVRPDNAPARRLYEASGYFRFGIYEDYYEDHADALRYEKPLLTHASKKWEPVFR